MLTDEDRAWLKRVYAEIHPPKDNRHDCQKIADRLGAELHGEPEPVFGKPRKATGDEVVEVFKITERAKLVVELICTSHFGAVGAQFYDHEQFPGTGAEWLFMLAEEDLPKPNDIEEGHWYAAIFGRSYKGGKKHPGSSEDFAWDLFSKYGTRKDNAEWCKKYKLREPRGRGHYDY